jgi:hypothetical protein
MASSSKYGKVNIPGLDEDEPIFILRAQDKIALPAIEAYRMIAVARNALIAARMNNEIDKFRKWKGPKKLPD